MRTNRADACSTRCSIGSAGRAVGSSTIDSPSPDEPTAKHIARWDPERQFPFANQILFDPVTQQTDGGLRACVESGTCPKIVEVNSENEYWAKAGSLLHTDTLGNGLASPRNVGLYLLSSLPHANGIPPGPGAGFCQQPHNQLVANRPLRA